MTGLALVADAFQSLRRTQTTVALYLLVYCGFELVFRLAMLLLPESKPDLEGPAWVRLVALAAFVLFAIIASVVQAVLFARMGKAIDRPLWKCEDDGEALRRFFSIWLVLNMFMLLLFRLLAIADRQEIEAARVILALLLMSGYALFFPVGVSAMYLKVTHWQEVPAALKTITSQFGLSLMVMFLGLSSFTYTVLLQDVLGNEPGIVTPLLAISAPVAFLDCLSFAAMWRVCMIHRDNPPEEDLDFY